MSVVSRIVLAGLASASLGIVQAAPTVARAQGAASAKAGEDGQGASTRGRFFHASKCVVTLGFSGGCDKDEAESKARADRAAEVAAADDNSTRRQFFHASKCVMSLGFIGGCDKDAPSGHSAPGGRHADAAPAAAEPDTSTRGQFLHASKCVVTLGFSGDCDKK